MLPSILVPVFIIVLALIWYGGITALRQVSARRARSGRDIRE
jgi:hypothetical protein